MRWISIAHLYQPANVDGYIIKEATERSYLRLLRAIEEHPNLHFTLNITGCLFVRWEELGYSWIVSRLIQLIKKGQVELMGSAAYHALLPLVPLKEAKRQIIDNEEILKKYLGRHYQKPKGFFFPEMAYSEEVAKLAKKLGYEWTVLDEIALTGRLGKADFGKTYLDIGSGLKVIIRSRAISNSYVPDTIISLLSCPDYPSLVITAVDGELYGLRHEDPTGELEKLAARSDIQTLTVSKFIKNLPCQKQTILPCHWNSTEYDLKKGNAYSLWYDPRNKLQMKLWDLFRLAYNTVEQNKRDKHYTYARWHLVRGMASCTFWWASAKDFRVFGPLSWSPDEIERGVNELVRAVRSLDSPRTRNIKIRAEKLVHQIKLEIWHKHWKKYWKN
ncbi:hypothetical protein D6821_01060 [Candidatus Parcubacteria bacterium]|nr:MAG: hypothetical protein D6821_01060 [Candidatus Parcubacteria bacterium]